MDNETKDRINWYLAGYTAALVHNEMKCDENQKDLAFEGWKRIMENKDEVVRAFENLKESD